MMREFGQMFLDRTCVEGLERRSSALVQLLAPLDQNRVVGHFLRQRVLEDVLGVADGRLLVNELAQLQVIEHAVEFVLRLLNYLTNQRQRKFTADDGQRLQQVLRIGGQPIDTRRQNPLYRRWNLQIAKWPREPGGATIADQRPLIEQDLHRLFHEERIALGFLDDQALERSDCSAVAEQGRQHRLGALPAQRIEPQLRVVSLAIPLMRILRAVVHQQQNLRGAQ